MNDVFEAHPDPVNHQIFEFNVLEASAHSLVWIINNTQESIEPVLAQFRELGCSTEGLEQFSLYAIDVPPHIADSSLEAVLANAESRGLDLAFPVWRRV